MRNVRSRKRPRSGGIVCASPSRCSSTDAPVPRRVRALRHLGELQRVAEQDDVARRRPDRERVRERHLARLVDEEVVDGAVELGPREQPRRPREQPHLRVGEVGELARALDPRAREDRLRAPGRLLQPLEVDALRSRPRARPRRAGCGSPCGWSRSRRRACPRRSRCDDQPRARPRLARAGRPLDDEVAAVEVEHEPLHLVEVGASAGPRARPAAARAAGCPRAPGSARCIARARRTSASRCGFVSNAPARDERARQRHVLEDRPAHEPQALAVELEDLAGLLPGRGIERPRRRPRACAPAPGNVNACTSERARGSGSEPSGSSSPIASASWTSSSGLLPSRSKKAHQTGFASRRWYSSRCAAR